MYACVCVCVCVGIFHELGSNEEIDMKVATKKGPH